MRISDILSSYLREPPILSPFPSKEHTVTSEPLFDMSKIRSRIAQINIPQLLRPKPVFAPTIKSTMAPAVPEREPAPEVPQAKEPTQRDTAGKRPFEAEMREVWGDLAEDAHSVLRREENGKIVGENTQYKYGKEADIPNRINPKTGKWDDKAPIVKIINPFTGEKEDSVDRGLFRINNGTFYDYLRRMPALLKQADITNWDDMLDPVKNMKMAKIIYDHQGWGAWFAAPASLRGKQ